MAKFKCLVSGNVIEFTNQVDIDSMKGHRGYIRLEEQEQQQPVLTVAKASKKTASKQAEVQEVIKEAE